MSYYENYNLYVRESVKRGQQVTQTDTKTDHLLVSEKKKTISSLTDEETQTG